MSRLSKYTISKIYIYAVPVLVIGLLAIITFVLLVPNVKETIEKNQQITQKKEQLTKLEKKRSLLESIGSSLTQQLLVLADQALPREKEVSTLLTAIENLSAQTHFAVDHVVLSPGAISTPSAQVATQKNTQPKELRHGAPVMEVSVNGKGNLQELMDFISKLQTSRRVMAIKNLQFTFNTEVPDSLESQMLLNIYYLPSITEISQIDEELPQISSTELKLLENLNQMPHISNISVTQTSPTQQRRRSNLFTNE